MTWWVKSWMQVPRADELIRRYGLAATELDEVLRSITADQLGQAPRDDEWSPLKVIHHIADAEVIVGQVQSKADRGPSATVAESSAHALRRTARAPDRQGVLK